MDDIEAPRQLTLLPGSEVPVQFRLDAETRQRGLRHIADIRRQLAERQAAKSDASELRQPVPNRPTAA